MFLRLFTSHKFPTAIPFNTDYLKFIRTGALELPTPPKIFPFQIILKLKLSHCFRKQGRENLNNNSTAANLQFLLSISRPTANRPLLSLSFPRFIHHSSIADFFKLADNRRSIPLEPLLARESRDPRSRTSVRGGLRAEAASGGSGRVGRC